MRPHISPPLIGEGQGEGSCREWMPGNLPAPDRGGVGGGGMSGDAVTASPRKLYHNYDSEI